MNRKLIAIVPAAGVGERAGSSTPKQYQTLHGQAMLRHTVKALLAEARLAQVRVIVAPHDNVADKVLHGLPLTVCRPIGGATRADTVMAALSDALKQGVLEADDWVLVHDAARPGLPANRLASLIDHCQQRGQGGLLALPVADTVKRGEPLKPGADVSQVSETLVRDGLWLAQTPQMFPVAALLQAYRQAHEAGVLPTDEASAMEAVGYHPLLIPGSPANLKVTWPDDFSVAAHWLQHVPTDYSPS